MEEVKQRKAGRVTSVNKGCQGSSLVAQWVKDLVLSLLWPRFDPWRGNFCMHQGAKRSGGGGGGFQGSLAEYVAFEQRS